MIVVVYIFLLAHMAYNDPTEPPVVATAPFTVGGGQAGTPVDLLFQVPATHDPPHNATTMVIGRKPSGGGATGTTRDLVVAHGSTNLKEYGTHQWKILKQYVNEKMGKASRTVDQKVDEEVMKLREIQIRFVVCLFTCLFTCSFVCLLVYLVVRLFVYLFVRLFVCLLICLFVCLLICLFVCLFVCLLVCLFTCLLIYLFTYLFVYLLTTRYREILNLSNQYCVHLERLLQVQKSLSEHFSQLSLRDPDLRMLFEWNCETQKASCRHGKYVTQFSGIC